MFKELTFCLCIQILPGNDGKEDFFNLTNNREEIHFDFLGECVANLYQNLEVQGALYVHATNEDFLANKLSNISIINFKLNAELSKVHTIKLYIILITNLSQLEIFLEAFYRTKAWSSKVNTIIILENYIGQAELLKITWKYFLVNIFIINRSYNIYTYSPTCGRQTPIFYGSCRNFKFITNKSSNKKACVYKVMALKIPPYVFNTTPISGVDIRILRELGHRIKFDLEFIPNSYKTWGLKLRNGTFTNMYEELYNKRIDIVSSSRFNETLNDDFDYTNILYYVEVSFHVPKADPVKPWKNIFIIFSSDLILSLLLTYALTLICCYIFAKSETGSYKCFIYSALTFWRVLFTSANREPTTNSLRILFLTWNILCFVIISCYQGFLASFFFKPGYEHQIDSQEKLANSKLQYGGYAIAGELLKSQQTEISERLHRNFIKCKVNSECTLRMFRDKDFAMLKSEHSHNVDIELFHLPKELNVISIKPKIRLMHTFYVRKGLPILDKMNILILRFQQYGLLDKWDPYKKASDFLEFQENNKKLTNNHLLGAFALLGIGFLISLIIFLVEYYRFK